MKRGRPAVEMVTVQCSGCPTTMTRYPSQVARNRTGRWFCSTECRNRVGSKPRRKASVTCELPRCRAEFYPRAGQVNRFCSRRCADEHMRRDSSERRCPECGATFRTAPSAADIWCSRACYDLSRQTPVGKRKINDDGYVLIYQPSSPEAYTAEHSQRGWGLEHRVVLAAKLGHALPAGSTVHHRNGRRADNRPSNLELRASQHGAGQDVLDLLDWARELIATYAADEPVLRELAALPV
jgi:HNH endonuclease